MRVRSADPTVEHDVYSPPGLPTPLVHEDSSEAAWALWDEAVGVDAARADAQWRAIQCR